jgi:hypothetical protein
LYWGEAGSPALYMLLVPGPHIELQEMKDWAENCENLIGKMVNDSLII